MKSLNIGDHVHVRFQVGMEAEVTGIVTKPHCDGIPQWFRFTCDHDFYDQLGRTWRSPGERFVRKGTELIARYDGELIEVIK